MDKLKSGKCWANVLRWTSRIYAALLGGLVIAIAVGEGPPNPFTQPLPVAIELFGMGAVVAGCFLVWKWEGMAAILAIAGMLAFHIIEKKLWLMGALPLFDLAGVLFLFTWYFSGARKDGGGGKGAGGNLVN